MSQIIIAGANKYLLFIVLVMGFLYLRSGWGKVSGGVFVGGLEKTLSAFAGKNPNPWVKNFLETVAIPNSTIFGLLTMWGEVLVALALTISAAYLLFSSNQNKMVILLLILGSIGGMFLNAIFWLSAGYTSPSTDGLNLLMFMAELAGLIYALKLLKAKSR